jgi:hypothetical protein
LRSQEIELLVSFRHVERATSVSAFEHNPRAGESRAHPGKPQPSDLEASVAPLDQSAGDLVGPCGPSLDQARDDASVGPPQAKDGDAISPPPRCGAIEFLRGDCLAEHRERLAANRFNGPDDLAGYIDLWGSQRPVAVLGHHLNDLPDFEVGNR